MFANIPYLPGELSDVGEGFFRSLASLPQAPLLVRGTSVATSKRFKNLKEMQATMQCDDGVPVYLKRGTRDKILYRFTLFLTAISIIDGVRFLWRWAKK